jgi:hypothetical protein
VADLIEGKRFTEILLEKLTDCQSEVEARRIMEMDRVDIAENHYSMLEALSSYKLSLLLTRCNPEAIPYVVDLLQARRIEEELDHVYSTHIPNLYSEITQEGYDTSSTEFSEKLKRAIAKDISSDNYCIVTHLCISLLSPSIDTHRIQSLCDLIAIKSILANFLGSSQVNPILPPEIHELIIRLESTELIDLKEFVSNKRFTPQIQKLVLDELMSLGINCTQEILCIRQKESLYRFLPVELQSELLNANSEKAVNKCISNWFHEVSWHEICWSDMPEVTVTKCIQIGIQQLFLDSNVDELIKLVKLVKNRETIKWLIVTLWDMHTDLILKVRIGDALDSQNLLTQEERQFLAWAHSQVTKTICELCIEGKVEGAENYVIKYRGLEGKVIESRRALLEAVLHERRSIPLVREALETLQTGRKWPSLFGLFQ